MSRRLSDLEKRLNAPPSVCPKKKRTFKRCATALKKEFSKLFRPHRLMVQTPRSCQILRVFHLTESSLPQPFSYWIEIVFAARPCQPAARCGSKARTCCGDWIRAEMEAGA